jgi:hypothetical protein
MRFVASGVQGAADKAEDDGCICRTAEDDNAVSRVLGVAQQNWHCSARSYPTQNSDLRHTRTDTETRGHGCGGIAP